MGQGMEESSVGHSRRLPAMAAVRLGITPVTVVGNCGGSQPHASKGVSEAVSDEWRRTVGEPIHGLDAASLTLEGQSQDTDTEKRVKLKIEQVVRWSRVVTCCVRTSRRGPITTFTLPFFVPLSTFHGLPSPRGLPLPASAYAPSVP